MSKLLITGGAGYIGSHVVHYLIHEEAMSPQDIIVFDNLAQGHRELLPEEVVFVEGDLREARDISALFATHEINSVIHLAGILNVAESMQQPAAYFQTNVVGGLNLLEAMRQSGCRTIVFSSSCTVYGQSAVPVTEDTVCDPISPYGESKLQFEQWLDWYSKVYGFKAISLRFFNAAGAAYGIGEWHEPEIHLIPSLLEAALNRRTAFTIYGDDYSTPDGTCVRDYIHVSDLAAAHVRALKYLEASEPSLEIFNLGSGRGSSVQEIVHLAEETTGKTINVHYAPRRPGDAAHMVANADRAAKELGWQPSRSIEMSVQDAWDWLQRRA